MVWRVIPNWVKFRDGLGGSLRFDRCRVEWNEKIKIVFALFFDNMTFYLF